MQTVAEHGTCLHLVCFLSGVQHIHHHGCDASLLYTMIWLAGAVGSPVEVPCGLRLKVRVCCAVLCWGLGQLQHVSADTSAAARHHHEGVTAGFCALFAGSFVLLILSHWVVLSPSSMSAAMTTACN